MKEVVLKIPEKEYGFFMKLVERLGFAKVEEAEGDSREDIIENLKEAFEEMKLIKEGKMKTTPAKDFLNEI